MCPTWWFSVHCSLVTSTLQLLKFPTNPPKMLLQPWLDLPVPQVREELLAAKTLTENSLLMFWTGWYSLSWPCHLSPFHSCCSTGAKADTTHLSRKRTKNQFLNLVFTNYNFFSFFIIKVFWKKAMSNGIFFFLQFSINWNVLKIKVRVIFLFILSR